MALATAGWQVTVTLEDLGSNRSTMQFFVDSAEVYADVAAAAVTLVGHLAAITDAGIMSYRLTEVFEDAVAVGAGEVENQALLVVETDDNKKALMRVPAASAGIFAAASGPNYNVVDILDADLVAYIGDFEAGAGVEFLVSDGQTVASLISGKRIHRGSNKG